MTSNIECFSVRQLSPFVGNIQIVQADYCRALSSDGLHWQIQASCETHQQAWNISGNEYIPRRYVLFGSWDNKNGFSSLPLDPMLDVPSIEHIENTLIHTLQHSAEKLPFAQLDRYECWLIDTQTGKPLALVNSTTHEYMIPHIVNKPWQAIPQQQSLASLSGTLTTSDIHNLESYINQNTTKQVWFFRQEDGSGISVSNKSHTLPAEHFPELLLHQVLLPESLQDSASSYIHWLSPRLLGLHFLSTACRAQLEQAAQSYALETSKRLNIYPSPLDPAIFNKIMVELKIRGH